MIDSYVALDLETTGLYPSTDRILEIGAVKVVEGKEVGTLSVLVNPGRQVSEHITRLTGITDEMALGGMVYEEAVHQLVEFCGDLPLLGHNILFDYSFVKQAAVNQKLVFEKKGVDTLKIARRLLPELEHRTLEYLCAYYGIGQERHHRAEDDARSAMSLYECLHQEFPDSPQEWFAPAALVYQAKKQSPITLAQKEYLNDLLKYHIIEIPVRVESLTKSEASRMIDKIILEHGRIPGRRQGTFRKDARR
ncbi:MAG: 3'-5' exonuclease [Lachnospiraceae bacterium]|nr:3'-5' exonuclease [Lachnospiraceae bacterium]